MSLVIFIVSNQASAMTLPFVPESSGICRLGDSLIIAGDEEVNKVWALRDGDPNPAVMTVSNAKWDDIEDLAAINDHQFFAMTSHSRTKTGKRKPEREQLMLIQKNKLNLDVKQSWNLRDQILKALEQSGADIDMEKAANSSPNEGGLNIEGFAYIDGQIYLGLRSPLTRQGEALLLVINQLPEVAQVIRLSLGNRGIRGLSKDKEGLAILSGSSTDAEVPFGLHYLDINNFQIQDFHLKGFEKLHRPEGINVEPDGSFVFVQDFLEPQKQNYIIRFN